MQNLNAKKLQNQNVIDSISSLKMIFFSRTIPIGSTVAVVPKLREMELAVIANLLPAIVVAVVMAFLPFSF